MAQKILWLFIDILFIAGGTAALITGVIPPTDDDAAGFGAFIIVVGILIRLFRKELDTPSWVKV